MRIAARVALAAVLAAGFAATAVAQGQGRQPGRAQNRQPGRGGFGGMMGGGGGMAYGMVANNKVLQEELKVTDEQKEKLTEALKPINEKRREMTQGFDFRNASEEERKEMREKQAKLGEETKKAVEGVLKPEQFKRLKQISYQMMSVNAFNDKDVQAELKMTDEQKEKVKAVVDEYNKDTGEMRRAAMQAAGGDREEMQKQFAEIQKKTSALAKEAQEKIEEKLTDDQKKAWKDLVGEKVDTAKIMQANMRPMRRDN